ncbi:hypothetical protein HK097_005606, partial [Rhizophlyctis rosea]
DLDALSSWRKEATAVEAGAPQPQPQIRILKHEKDEGQRSDGGGERGGEKLAPVVQERPAEEAKKEVAGAKVNEVTREKSAETASVNSKSSSRAVGTAEKVSTNQFADARIKDTRPVQKPVETASVDSTPKPTTSQEALSNEGDQDARRKSPKRVQSTAESRPASAVFASRKATEEKQQQQRPAPGKRSPIQELSPMEASNVTTIRKLQQQLGVTTPPPPHIKLERKESSVGKIKSVDSKSESSEVPASESSVMAVAGTPTPSASSSGREAPEKSVQDIDRGGWSKGDCSTCFYSVCVARAVDKGDQDDR